MAGGLAALLDDVAAIAKLTSAASTKALGVVVDDAAVTPRYVAGLDPSRELPIIAKIARGSLINKLLFILPVAMLLSQFAPWLLTPLLMIGGTYLSYEGTEKLYEAIFHRGGDESPAVDPGGKDEDSLVKGAVTTDFILSSEIMVISLQGVATQPFITRLFAMIGVGILMAVIVYGAVAMIVKMDDVGLRMMKHEHTDRTGELLVELMPRVMAVLSVVGVAAMLWVGGHILLTGTDTLGWHLPHEVVHHLEAPVLDRFGAAAAWLVNTVCSALVGVLVGAVVVAITQVLPLGHSKDSSEQSPVH